MTHSLPSQDAPSLQQTLVDTLIAAGRIQSPDVEASFRAVPRHLFVPDAPLETVYSNTHIVTKTIEGRDVSSSSQPSMMAIMLEQLDLRAGQRVLEIGAGTGYNAALMAHIVGPAGQVVTIDIDEDIVAAARAHLAAAGFERVRAICSDGGMGHPDAAPYDRIIVTVGTDDIAPAWREQLRHDGRLVVPIGVTSLDMVSGSKVLATFDHVDDHLESRILAYCRFVPLRGVFAASPVGLVPVGPLPGLNLIADGSVDSNRIYTALAGPYHDYPVGIAVTARALWGLQLWLALHDHHFCGLLAQGERAEQGIVPFFDGQRGLLVATVGLCSAASLSVLTYAPNHIPTVARPVDPDRSCDLVARTFDEDTELARRLIAHVATWDRAGRPFSFGPRWSIEGPYLRAYARDTPYVPSVHEAIIDQQSARLVLNWEHKGVQS